MSTLTPYKHFLRLLLDSRSLRTAPQAWFPLFRLIRMPRYIEASTNILGPKFEFVDSASFVSTYVEIFGKEIYRFPASSPEPYILDGGANIGLSVYYFKWLYPACHIIAFEPDPNIFAVLQRNVARLKLKDVELHNQALWTEESTIPFQMLGADAGRLVMQESKASDVIEAPTIRLRDLLHRPIDLLKLDIEGAETTVLSDCADHLQNVERLFVEYHSYRDRQQDLHVLINTLAQAGFRVHIHPCQTSPSPFDNKNLSQTMDMQLNIFAYRDQESHQAHSTNG